MLTKAELFAMKEDELRTRVLVPLFKAMGFQQVEHYHGGNERGKDIVIWKADELSVRVNYAVVAKRGGITGKASGTSSAATVVNQMQQCFGSPSPIRQQANRRLSLRAGSLLPER